jgi:hypothetical protein
LLLLNNEPIFRIGEWRVVHEHVSEHGLICWLWKYENAYALVVINYAETDAIFSLTDQLHLLHLKDPVDMISGNKRVDAHQIHSLAPWNVYAWKVIGV